MDENKWLEIVRSCCGLTQARIERIGETGDANTIRITGILKVSNSRRELRHLDHFRKVLGNDYVKVFPDYTVHCLKRGLVTLELQYLSDSTLESLLQSKSLNDSGNDLLEFVEKVGLRIELFSDFVAPKRSRERVERIFFMEVAQALIRNSQLADIRISLAGGLKSSSCGVEFLPVVCHRDLSAANVMCMDDGSVRFIDSRDVVPGAKQYSSEVYGSSAIDCAAFLVSLERKDLEREKVGLDVVGAADKFRLFVDNLISRDVFSNGMFDICLAHAYSVYAACPCSYCFDSERRWLHEIMSTRLSLVIDRLIIAGIVKIGLSEIPL